MSTFLCSYCSHSFSTKSNLIAHQKKTIYCLELQNKKPLPSKTYTCHYCSKIYRTKDKFIHHEQKCTAKNITTDLENKIKNLESKIADLDRQNLNLLIEKQKDLQYINKLEKQLEDKERNQQHLSLAAITRPTTSVKNTIKNAIIQNLLPLKEDEMKLHVPQLTIDHIKEGPEGYAKFALNHPLKNRITCTDVSRKKLAWKNERGEIVYDTEGQALCKKFFVVIQEKSEGLFKELIKELGERLRRAYDHQDQEEADAIVELTEKVQTWRREAFQASKGSANELTLDFASYLCKMSVTDSIPLQSSLVGEA